MRIPRFWLGAGCSLLAALAVSMYFFHEGAFGTRESAVPLFSYEELTGSVFLPAPKEPLRAPAVRELSLPPIDGATSVWGATGRDFRGHIWVGVTATGKSAHLFEYDPATDLWRDRGAVVEQLRAARVYRDGEGQAVIHSKIVPAGDGWLYFTSTDGEEQQEDGSQLPRWGGHLWRIHPERHTWQHLAAVPEGLVAAAGVGRYVYALGYWGHVLYQYDTIGRTIQRVVVGSVGGHISRNFLADVRGHAYVPRVSARQDGSDSAALVEYDSNLKEVASTQLEHYFARISRDLNHGIVGLAYLPDGRMLFTTHSGHLYQIAPQTAKPAAVTAMGWLHPHRKPVYAPSLFVLGGNTLLGGVVQNGNVFEWVVYDLESGESSAFPLDTKKLPGPLLYGSVTRDNDGRAYVGGWASSGKGRQRPVILQIDPGR